MYFYFSADYPAVLKVNGVYQGEITKSVKKVDVDCDCAFIEFCPLVPTQKFLSFLLNEQFILSPTENFAVTDLNGGYLIKGLKNHTYSDFRVLCQQKYNDAVVTVFTENTLKITIESTTDFLAETVAFSAYDAKIHRFDLDGSNFICIEFIGEQTLLAVYDLNLNKQFFRLVDGFSFDGGFTTTQKYFDIAKHAVTSTWGFNGQFYEKNKNVCVKDSFTPTALSVDLLPYAFLEELLVGGDVSPYLTEQTLSVCDKLKEYLGEFIGVMPPPEFIESNYVGLIYAKSERNFYVNYIAFEFENLKICNAKKREN